MFSIRLSRPSDVQNLYEIWHEAVQATHSFLSEQDIAFYAQQVLDSYLPSRPFWVAVGQDDKPRGFLGMTGSKIDALFIHPDFHGQGIGRALVDHAGSLSNSLTVDVNEQNGSASAFYRRLGFRQTGRSELDDSARPFPLLHLARP
jgi:putative acetyltransferase